MTIPSLPRADEDPEGRAAGLARAREELAYAWDRPPGVAMAREVPSRLGFPVGVLTDVARSEALLLANRAAVRLGQGLHAPSADAPSSIASCSALFATISAPPIAALHAHGMQSPEVDRAFAWQRVGGANPFVIERIARVPDRFAVDDAALARVAPGDSLEAAGAEGRLFLCDYALLEGLTARSGEPLAAPLALFVRAAGESGLRPVAIQCAQTPGTKVLGPHEGVAWQMARVVVQIADANVHESFQHLGRAHFLLEAFGMAMERQLSTRHPLFVLLSPHLHGTLAINNAARDKLVVPGGELDELMAPSLESSLALVRRGLETFELPSATFANDLERRGVASTDALPDYPFRDDAALIHAAIEAFVSDAVHVAYATDADVGADVELRAFLDELRSAEGGRLSGVPRAIQTRAALVELVTFIAYSASARHAALNYSQADFMGWIPNMPTAGHAPPPTGPIAGGVRSADATELDGSAKPSTSAIDDEAAAWARMLPPHGLASKQLEFMWRQSQVRANRLGHYAPGHFADSRLDAALARFQGALDDAERVIAARNATRFLPYPYLAPHHLTASIHI